MKKTIKTIFLLLMILGLSLSMISCGTAALWRDQANDTQKQQADVAETNGSEKYIVFAALNSSGALIAGGGSGAVAYAVVGYTGLMDRLVIPATYLDSSINANALNVTKVLVATPSYASYCCSRNGAAYSGDDARLNNEQNSTVIKSIVFGSNVNYVGGAVCAGMLNLESVTFASTSAVTLGDGAFMYCAKLATVTGTYSDANGTAFTGCAYAPQP